jgi:hypothetical protein
MNRETAINRSLAALGLAILFMTIAVPALAIAGEIQRARADRPDRVQIGQPRLPSAPELVADVLNSVLRPGEFQLHSAPASERVPDEAPSVRKLPGRLGP